MFLDPWSNALFRSSKIDDIASCLTPLIDIVYASGIVLCGLIAYEADVSSDFHLVADFLDSLIAGAGCATIPLIAFRTDEDDSAGSYEVLVTLILCRGFPRLHSLPKNFVLIIFYLIAEKSYLSVTR